jgi:hypothetical protein
VSSGEHLLVTEGYGAGVGVGEPCDQPEQGRLPAPGRPQDGGKTVRGDVQVDFFEYPGGTEGLGDPLDGQRGHPLVPLLASRVRRQVAGAEMSTMTGYVRRCGAVGDAVAVAPELRGQGLRADRGQQQRGRQLGHHGDENQRDAGAKAGRDQRHRNPSKGGDAVEAHAVCDVVEDRRSLRERGADVHHGTGQEEVSTSGG